VLGVTRMDALKWYAMVPGMHMCACEVCAQLLTQATTSTYPACYALIQWTTRVYLV